MQTNGSGRNSNDQWTTVLPPRKHHRTFRQLVDDSTTKSFNPYQLLRESPTPHLTKVELPQGETIYSTFQSIPEISAYFANLLIHMEKTNDLATSLLRKEKSGMLKRRQDHTQSFNTCEIHTQLEFSSTDLHLKSNPQNSDNDFIVDRKVPTSRSKVTMASKEITTAIRGLLGELDITHIREDLAKNLCKKSPLYDSCPCQNG